MNKNNQMKELSYFTLKLKRFLSEHYPNCRINSSLFSARCEEALRVYSEAVARGDNHIQAEELSNKVLFQGLHFTPYDMLVLVLENEFLEELPEPLPHKIAPILLRHKAIQRTFAKYKFSDDFESSPKFEELYLKLIGTIVLIIEKNKLPVVKPLK